MNVDKKAIMYTLQTFAGIELSHDTIRAFGALIGKGYTSMQDMVLH